MVHVGGRSIQRIQNQNSELTQQQHSLDKDTAARVLDTLIQPPATHKYTTLKDRLVDTFQRSERKAVAKILREELSNSRLSEMMGKMLALVPPPTSASHFPFCLTKYSSASPGPHNSGRDLGPTAVRESSQYTLFYSGIMVSTIETFLRHDKVKQSDL